MKAIVMAAIRSGELFRYALAGGVATLVEWGSFYLLAIAQGLSYRLVVVISLWLGASTNYAVNKIFTFRCPSREIARQYGAHLFASMISWGVHLGVMIAFVDGVGIEKMTSKVLTTALLLFPNYILYKRMVFSR